MIFNNKGNKYFIDEEFLTQLKKWNGYIIVVGGPSGVGKTTLSENLGFQFVTSFTTREKRKVYETYDFITSEEYDRMEKEKAFATGVKFNKDKYGVTKERFFEEAAKHDVLVLTMSPIGYRMLKKRYPRTIGIFVYADWDVVKERLMKRDGALDEVRVASYENNLRSKDFYHIKINNNRNTLLFKTLKVKFLIKVIRFLDHNKKTYKLRKRVFAVKNENIFKQQSKARKKKRKNSEMT